MPSFKGQADLHPDHIVLLGRPLFIVPSTMIFDLHSLTHACPLLREAAQPSPLLLSLKGCQGCPVPQPHRDGSLGVGPDTGVTRPQWTIIIIWCEKMSKRH